MRKRGVLRNGTVSRQLHCLSGTVEVPRQRYRCRDCGASFYEKSGFWDSLRGRTITEALWEFAIRMALSRPYEETCEQLQDLFGTTVTPTGLRDELVIRGRAESEREREEAHEEAQFRAEANPAPPSVSQKRRYVEMDGCFIHTWHRKGMGFEIKVGEVFTDPILTESKKRKWIEHKEYVSFAGSSAEFGERLFTVGERWRLSESEELYVLGDGASWIKSLWSHYFPHGKLILDWWHAQKAVRRTVEALVSDTESRERYRDKITSALFEGKLASAVAAIEQLPATTEKRLEKRDDLVSYLLENKEGIPNYHAVQEQGIHIGSGVIENACKNAVGRRMKHRGMGWTRDGAEAMMCLRTRLLNYTWPRYWKERGLRRAA